MSGDGGGTFDYGVDCGASATNTSPACGSGGSSPAPGPLSFTVTITGGGTLNASSFNLANGNGFVVASDVIDNNSGSSNGKTGLVEATGITNVPEPGTFALLGMGIVGLVGLRRKRVTA